MPTRRDVSHAHIDGALTFEDILGKDVYDEANEFVGVSNNVYIKPDVTSVIGISIDKGFTAKELVVGSSFIRDITGHAVFLSVRPAFRMRGMTVFDKHGTKVGVVKDLTLDEERNEVRELIVRSAPFRTITIPRKYVKQSEDNVILKVAKEQACHVKARDL